MAESRGYLKLDRNVRDNRLWPLGEFSQFEAWVDLLLRAAWRNHKVDFGGEWRELKPGELVTSYRVLGNAWGWSPNRARRLIVRLIENGTLTARTTAHRNTLISICNWSKYQYPEKERHTNGTQNDTPTAHRRHTNGTREKQVNTVKQEKHVPDDDEGFAEFWSAWPRKVNKADALKAWRQTAGERPPVAELVAAITAAKRSHEWRQKQWVPYPASWLRGHRWLDELTARADDNGRGSMRRPGDLDRPAAVPVPPKPRLKCEPLALDTWADVAEILGTVLDPHSFGIWIRPTTGLRFDNDELVVAVPNDTFADWLAEHYHAEVKAALAGRAKAVRFEVVS